ncbi:PREDICTED: putative disease resistance RPP13-like protein 1 [Theobroma cacao]|uniref:Disease resistance RPP13-like protein 1 n=1 Tax=Theobroma cacao TaxID=3641 RepID=A0AB32WZD4_THECC|nr:PREDICTED: putative disease resistance RPP13-like protein 1 [Theobroma cacao]XP_017984034.1 PREDICTED: putative disease resistance RPP13-like protein 1 [Theobroma cacao]XP_017984035.1 PREDICTED: putative disease resistance RPP13-like protein 1 [Theobroma cacao]XP_017984036.1 PREDICTED: putative disease resistance RPP13-like protein 1 [Theobroma cacao]
MAFFADAALSAFFDSLFAKFSSSDFNFVTEKLVRKEIMNWETILRTIHAVLADAEEKKMKNQAVKIWLADLQDLAYDVDDILDEFATEALGRRLMKEHQASTSKAQRFVPTCCTSLHPSSIMFNYKMMSKIKEITGRLQDLATKKINLQLENYVGRPMIIPKSKPSTSLVNEATVRGRDKDKKAIIDLLLRKDGNDAGVSVIPITGMGGIGKTTLAQLVYNDSSIRDYFNLKAWVCVSDEFDVIKITKTILESVTFQSCDIHDLNLLQVKLKEKLSGKKFLLVLDDVWNENYDDWTKLRSPFDAGITGSKIIVTTRSSNVSSIMRSVADYLLQSLSEDDSLSLLSHHALARGDFTGHPDLKEIGLEIVKKCGGLPLAIKTIGGLLRTRENHDAWKYILMSDIWSIPEEKSDIIPALWLSYYYLPPQLKQCFAYCSFVPKDYEFKEEEIVLLWMAEGFLNGANTKGATKDLGSKYFEELVSRSFFQASRKNQSQFVMHDLINDLAQLVAGEIYFKRERYDDMKGPISRTRHSSYIIGKYDRIEKFEAFFEAKFLRTYLPFDMMMMRRYGRCYLSSNVLDDLLPRLKCLRVLSLKRYYIKKIPSSIGNLKHLRYLDFSYTEIKSLPDSICTLYNLETLLLRFCDGIEKLPMKIGILDNLCHLDITGANSIKEMPSGIGKLTNLQVLSTFIVGQGDGLNIREMQNLSNLKGQLCISKLHNVDEAQYAWEAKLSGKSSLNNLELSWSRNFNENLRNKEVEGEVLTLLQPHEELKALAIKYYAGLTFPIWLEDGSLKNLQFLNLEDCQNCKSLPAIGKLPLLKHLCIKGMRSVISVGIEFHGVNWPNLFPSLETLHFEDMLEWKEWKVCEINKQGKKFCCLRELLLKNCPKLVRTLPNDLHSLEKLVIRNCQELTVSVSNLPMLCEFEIDGCKEVVLESFDDLWSVKKIILSNISKFTCVTKETKKLESAKVVNLQINGCEELTSLWQTKWGWLAPLRSLHSLKFQNCPQVVCIGATDEEEEELLQLELPCNIEYVILVGCQGLERLSKSLQNLTCLTKLNIVRCSKLVSLSVDSLPLTLRTLDISDCENLQCLLDDEENINFSSTSLLESLDIGCCEALKSLSSSGKLPVRCKKLFIYECPVLRFLAQNIGDNACLESISLHNCINIKYLPQGLDKLNHLQEIDFDCCPSLVGFPESGLPIANLKTLRLVECAKLEALPTLHTLQQLTILGCPRVRYSIEENGFHTNLTELDIDEPNISKALMIWGLHRLTSLTKLDIDGSNCIEVVSFPQEEIGMKLPPSLTHLSIGNFKNMKKVSSNGFQNLTSLQSLKIYHCPKLKSLPRKEMLRSLSQLLIYWCPVLKERCKRGKGKQWSNIAHIPYIEID